MHDRILLPLALLVLIGLAPLAQAQEPPPAGALRIAVAVPARIFDNLEEMRELQQRMLSDQQRFFEERNRRLQEIQALEQARNQLRPDMPQFTERHNEWLNATIEFQAWEQRQQHDRQRIQKRHMKNLFDKIQAATGEVARQQGIQLVLSEPQLPPVELITPEELRAIINQRNVLFAENLQDISDDVIRVLNEQYQRERPGD
jgi:Skp family chaperone for outer membrane proteins